MASVGRTNKKVYIFPSIIDAAFFLKHNRDIDVANVMFNIDEPSRYFPRRVGIFYSIFDALSIQTPSFPPSYPVINNGDEPYYSNASNEKTLISNEQAAQYGLDLDHLNEIKRGLALVEQDHNIPIGLGWKYSPDTRVWSINSRTYLESGRITPFVPEIINIARPNAGRGSGAGRGAGAEVGGGAEVENNDEDWKTNLLRTIIRVIDESSGGNITAHP
jgi:hypothetical protein